jgi:hypothetical protein
MDFFAKKGVFLGEKRDYMGVLPGIALQSICLTGEEHFFILGK